MDQVFRIKCQHTIQIHYSNTSMLVITKPIDKTTLSSSDFFCSDPEGKSEPLYLY